MIIKFKGNYKSLNTFESETLNKFTIITGKNGSGKSQLNELFRLKIDNELSPNSTFDLEPEYTKIQCEGIVGTNLKYIDNEKWKEQVIKIVKNFSSYSKSFVKLGEIIISTDLTEDELTHENLKSKIDKNIITNEELDELIKTSLFEMQPNFNQIRPNSNIARISKRLFEIYKKQFVTFQLCQYISKHNDKEIHELSDVDFYRTPIPAHFLNYTNMFGSQLEFVFYNYAKMRDQNRRLYFDKIQDGVKNEAITDEDFIAKLVPPWKLINDILESHGINFKFKELEIKDFTPDTGISFQLIKKSINKEIRMDDLSSGEKVIIGLIFKLFTSEYYKDKLDFPELVVLDEPDAHLHPEMSKMLLDVLNDTFVEKLGISVIMTTHSPSTVALAPDNSIYQLLNEPDSALVKIEKEDALEILTGHLPTLSIDYKNHKQVFVESPTDVKYYQTIFNKLNQDKAYPFRLYFISNSSGNGNCDQVINVVTEIRKSGNKTAYGIIDWDLKNNSTEFVKVHGEKKRYSIENYLYDPIYLTVLLMNLKGNNIFTELGIDETYNQYNIGNENQEFLQKISDWFFNKYYTHFKIEKVKQEELVAIEYLNGKKIMVPKWYTEIRGHDLEIKIKKIFNSIEGKYPSEVQLQNELTLIIGKCYPFIPKDSSIVIEEIIK